MWKDLFSGSSRDHGTLGHLCCQLGRLPQAKVPKKDLHASLDALHTIFKGHIVAAACSELGLESSDVNLPEAARFDRRSPDKMKAYIQQLSEKLVNKYTISSEAILNESIEESRDGVNKYALVLCHYAALVFEFTDAWREGDGERVLRCWKIFLLHFYADRRTKYALEALRLQFKLATLPPHLVHHLTWGRFVNTHGGYGHNIPCDLHNEHVNKLFKDIIGNMGANFTEQASTQAARAVTSLAAHVSTVR